MMSMWPALVLFVASSSVYIKSTGDNCQFLYFPFMSIPMTRHELTHAPFTSVSHTDGPKAEPTLQPPGLHQSNKCRAQSPNSKTLQPLYF